ncbi:hypothetical protein PybrP1_000373, partial [[Pythium] brassicae (nom. inval.)]
MQGGLADDEDDEGFVCVLAILYVDSLSGCCERVMRTAFNWNIYITELLRMSERFQRRYRMSLPTFIQVCRLIAPSLRTEHMNSCVNVNIVLHCTLHRLTGGSYDDISWVVSINMSTLENRKLCAATPWRPGSLQAWMRFLISVRRLLESAFMAPCKAASGSGRLACPYQDTSYNGNSAGDVFLLWSLPRVQVELIGLVRPPLSVHVAFDSVSRGACGSQELSKDAFNFFLNQLLIRIEQAFGLMVTKWRILKKPLEVKLKNIPQVIHAIIRLHSFCIDSREEQYRYVSEIDRIFDDCTTLDSWASGYIPSTVGEADRPRTSILRERFREHLASRGLTRPTYN